MVKTEKGSLSGAWLFLLGVALFLLLLPTAFGQNKCKAWESKYSCFKKGEKEWCVKKWFGPGHAQGLGCATDKDFLREHGFEASDGKCAESKDKDFVCACDYEKKDLCNDGDFGENEYKKWKAEKDDANKGGHSSGLGLSNLVPVTLTALLTLGVILGR